MAYWCGVAFGIGTALFFVGLGTIPVDAGTLPWLKWGGAVVALGGCMGAYMLRNRAGMGTSVTRSPTG
jgi:hypothetical protein